jgi:hypothetical protein
VSLTLVHAVKIETRFYLDMTARDLAGSTPVQFRDGGRALRVITCRARWGWDLGRPLNASQCFRLVFTNGKRPPDWWHLDSLVNTLALPERRDALADLLPESLVLLTESATVGRPAGLGHGYRRLAAFEPVSVSRLSDVTSR